MYEDKFPVSVKLVGEDHRTYGKVLSLELLNDKQYKVALLKDGNEEKAFNNLNYKDTVAINGFSIVVDRTDYPLDGYLNKAYTIGFFTSDSRAKFYSGKLRASWQEQGASVINLDINGKVPAKEIAFLEELISQYQAYDLDKKNQAAIRTIEFIDKQLTEIADSLRFFEGQVESFKKNNVNTNLEGDALSLYKRI